MPTPTESVQPERRSSPTASELLDAALRLTPPSKHRLLTRMMIEHLARWLYPAEVCDAIDAAWTATSIAGGDQ